MKEGTYEIKMVRNDNFLFREITQASSQIEATKKIKAMYPEFEHISTRIIEQSEGEKNKALVEKETEILELKKVNAEKKAKRETKRKSKNK